MTYTTHRGFFEMIADSLFTLVVIVYNLIVGNFNATKYYGNKDGIATADDNEELFV